MNDEDQNIAWYDTHAIAFAESTVPINMDTLYKPFLSKLSPGASILDAGCGPGRDALYFKQQGYKVTAFDASEAMVRHAKALTGLAVRQIRYQDLRDVGMFDGIWNCASLLHIPANEMDFVFRKLWSSLKPLGIMYVSFKYGLGEESREGRWFTSHNERTLGSLIARNEFEALKQWVTTDMRPGRENEKWLNAILKKPKLC